MPRVKTSHLKSNPCSLDGSTSSDTEDLYLTQDTLRQNSMLKKELLIMQAVPASLFEMELFSPLPLSFVYKIKPKLSTIHWGYDCIQSLMIPTSKGSEKLKCKNHFLVNSRAADVLMKQHILKTSLSEIQGLCELHVFIYWKTAVLSTSFTIQPLVLPYLIVQQASSSTLVSSRLRDEKKYVNKHCLLSFQFIPGSCCTDHRVMLLALKFLVSQTCWKLLPFTLWFHV